MNQPTILADIRECSIPAAIALYEQSGRKQRRPGMQCSTWRHPT